jgi:hypothetical protein
MKRVNQTNLITMILITFMRTFQNNRLKGDFEF